MLLHENASNVICKVPQVNIKQCGPIITHSLLVAFADDSKEHEGDSRLQTVNFAFKQI
jgi:S-ribosylhomocysteine lyase LuxS involved in autoinducer biosynthesis